MKPNKFEIRNDGWSGANAKLKYYGNFYYPSGERVFQTRLYSDRRPLFKLISLLSTTDPITVIDTTTGEFYNL